MMIGASIRREMGNTMPPYAARWMSGSGNLAMTALMAGNSHPIRIQLPAKGHHIRQMWRCSDDEGKKYEGMVMDSSRVRRASESGNLWYLRLQERDLFKNTTRCFYLNIRLVNIGHRNKSAMKNENGNSVPDLADKCVAMKRKFNLKKCSRIWYLVNHLSSSESIKLCLGIL